MTKENRTSAIAFTLGNRLDQDRIRWALAGVLESQGVTVTHETTAGDIMAALSGIRAELRRCREIRDGMVTAERTALSRVAPTDEMQRELKELRMDLIGRR